MIQQSQTNEGFVDEHALVQQCYDAIEEAHSVIQATLVAEIKRETQRMIAAEIVAAEYKLDPKGTVDRIENEVIDACIDVCAELAGYLDAEIKEALGWRAYVSKGADDMPDESNDSGGGRCGIAW